MLRYKGHQGEALGGFDLIEEVTGHSESLQQALCAINPSGHLVCLGHQAPMKFEDNAHFASAIKVLIDLSK